MKYVPDSYDYKKLEEIGLTNEEFLNLQIKYREGFESYLKDIIDFNEINSYILMKGELPKVDDEDRNFYHKYSTLGSNYIFLRSNVHIERLTPEEINILKLNPTSEFYQNTYDRVLFETEEDVNIMIGSAIPANAVKGRSIIIEFSHDMKKETSEQMMKADEISKYLKDLFEKYGEARNIPISFLEYKAIPDYFLKEE